MNSFQYIRTHIEKFLRFLFQSEINFNASILFGFSVAQNLFKLGLKEKFILKNNVKPLLYLVASVILILIMFNKPLFNNEIYVVLIHYQLQIFGALYLLFPMHFSSREKHHPFFLSIFSLLGLFPFLFYTTLLAALVVDSPFWNTLLLNWMTADSVLSITFLTIARIFVTSFASYCFKSYYILHDYGNIFTTNMKNALQQKGFDLKYLGTTWTNINNIILFNNIDKIDIFQLKIFYQNKWKVLNYLVVIFLQLLGLSLMLK